MNYLYTGARYDTTFAKTNQVDELLDVTGGNTGNLLIGDAIRRHLNIKSQFLLRNFHPSQTPQIEEEYDAIVIGASNFLREGVDLESLANIIEKINLPCIIIGLGAQSPKYGDKINVSKGTLRLMKIISERSKTLGVRGSNTAYVLDKLGIKNVNVIGCPSMFWTKEPTLKISRKPFNNCHKIAVNGSANVIAHSVDPVSATRIEHWLARLSYKDQYPYILQNELYEMKILSGEQYLPTLIHTLKRLYGMDNVSSKDFTNHIKNNMKVFFDIETWRNFISGFDLVVGTRFHGNLIGLLCGVPSILFAHDSRTSEMAEVLGIPSMDIREVTNPNLKDVYENTDFSSLETKFQHAYKNYIEFLDENKLEHTLTS